MKVQEIDISKIKIYQNIRSEKKDVASLMKSIEQEGLLHPIGVYQQSDTYTLAYGYRRLQATKKLNWKTIPAVILSDKFTEEDFLSKNTIENIHRIDINPLELGRVCSIFMERGFSPSEIAAKLHLSNTRIRTVLQLYRKCPKEYRDLIGFIPRGEPNKGKIPANVAIAILALRINTAQMREILEYAKVHEMTTGEVFLIEKVMRTNVSFGKALKNIGKYAVKNINIAIVKKEWEKVDTKDSFTKYIHGIIRGDEDPNKDLLVK